MAVSMAMSDEYACPRCGTAAPFECWLVVDALERPDLAARIADGTLHRMQCGQCGNLGEVQAPLLVYRANSSTRLVFSPVEGSPEDIQGRDAHELLTMLRQRLREAWRDDWLTGGLMILPRGSLGLLLRSGDRVQIVAADHAAEATWQRYLAERAPDVLDMAIGLWRDALALAGEAPDAQAGCRLGLGRCLAERFGLGGNLADLDAAIDTLQPARTAAARGGPARPKVLLVLGNVLTDRHKRDPRHREDLDEAINCYAEAAELIASDDPDAAVSLGNYAGALKDRYARDHRRADLDTAISVLERATGIGSVGDRQRGLVQDTLASALLARFQETGDHADLDAAVGAYARAVALVPAEDPDRPAFLHNQAFAFAARHAARGRADDARAATDCFRAACQAGERGRPERVLEASAGWALWASTQRAWNDVASASSSGFAALEALTAANVLLTDRQSWQRQARGLVMTSAYALARLGRIEEAAVLLESHWAKQLNERLGREGAEMDALQAIAPALHEQYRRAAAGLRVLEAEEVLAGLRSTDASAPASLSHLRQRFTSALDDMARVTASIRQQPGFERFAGPIDFQAISESVDTDEALVYLLVTAVGSVALLITRDADGPGTSSRSEAVWADDFSVEDLDRLLVDRSTASATGYLPAMFGGGDPDGNMLEDAIQAMLPVLGARLLAPVAARLRALATRRVALVEGGLLKLLPLAAAPYPAGTRRSRRQACLLDEWTVTHVPSARALARARRGRGGSRATPSLLAVANPLPLPDDFDPLDGALEEVRAIASRFGSGEATVLEGPDATYDAVAAAAARATHVHFACHGFFSAVNPQLSLLVLSDGQPLLLYNVLYNVKWSNARLAVLSACDSAQIDYRNLPDEAVGLPAGFLQAGVPGVVGALWPVEDEATALLMDRFYRNLLGSDSEEQQVTPMPPAEALRHAQRFLRDESPFDSPLYWAPFVFHGV